MWTKEIPKEDGYYWFFGYPWGKNESIPKLEMVRVKFGILIVDEAFNNDHILGVFYKVELPNGFDPEIAKWVKENLLGKVN